MRETSVLSAWFAHNSRAGHPGWRRCSSLKYSRYSRSSRLAIRAPRSGTYAAIHADRTLADSDHTLARIDGASAFGFSAAMMVLQFVLVWMFLPETKGASLERIQRTLGID